MKNLFLVVAFVGLGSLCGTPRASAAENPVANPVEKSAAKSIDASVSALPSTTGRLEGLLLEKGTKKPLPDMSIFLLPLKLKATTDAKGRFVFEGVPAGEWQIVVNATGYMRLEKQEKFSPEAGGTRRLYLERATYQGLETVVVDRAKKRDDAKRTLKTEQFISMPGANGDPVKAVQNLPGVARAQGFSSQVIIQGSAPNDTSYLIDDHEAPLIFHFGGLTSVITPEAIEQVDYLSAGYGPEYGRAMGGLVGLKTKNPATDRQKGFLFMDTTKAGGLIEGPIDEKSSYLLTARYSYIGFVLGQALKDNPRFDLTVAPSFADITGIYHRHLSPDDELKVVTIASRDELKFLFKEPLREDPSVRGNFSSETGFYRLIPQWTHRFDPDTTGRLSLGVGQNIIKFDVGDNFFDLQTLVVSNRGEWEKKVSPEWRTYIGFDNSFERAKARMRVPTSFNQGGVSNPISTGEQIEIDVTQDIWLLGPYWRNQYRAEGSKWEFLPSARLDYIGPTKEWAPQPRLGLRYEADESLNLKAATGLYYQPPEPQEIASSYGNPDVKSPYSWHYTVGAEKDFRGGSSDGFSVQSNLFYRQFENLVVSSSKRIERDGVLVFERFNNEGRGRSFGAEFLIKYDAKPWSGWLAYTVSRSYRTEPGQDEHLFRYDQTHNVNLVGSRELDNNWKISTRLRYVTGNPVTPVTGGTFDTDNDVYVPVRGPYFSERLEPFFQLDLRADKKWVYDEWILWGYLDVQNITNAQNSEAVRYSYDYSQKRTVTGLPVFPTIGVRGEF